MDEENESSDIEDSTYFFQKDSLKRKRSAPNNCKLRYSDGSNTKISENVLLSSLICPDPSTTLPITKSSNLSVASSSFLFYSSTSDPFLKASKCAYLDGKFFKVVEYFESENKVTGECQMCLPKKTNIRGALGVSTNFLKHLKYIHNALQEYNNYKLIKKGKLKPVIKTNNEPKKIIQSKPINNNKFEKNIIIDQNEFDKRVIRFLYSSITAANIIKNSFFTQLFDGFNVKIMNFNTAMQKVEVICDETIINLEKELNRIEFVCITIDIWSVNNITFFGLACHWINSSFLRDSAVLTCKRLNRRQINKIDKLIEDVYLKFSLNQEKVLSIISDNCPNYINGFNDIGVNLFDNDDDNDDHDDKKSIEIENKNSNELEFIEISDKISPCVPKHFRCMTYTLNLIIVNDIKSAIESDKLLCSIHYSTLSKCNALWKLNKFSQSANKIKLILGHTFNHPGIIKEWSNFVDALSEIVSVKEKLPIIFDQFGMKNKNFKEYELSYLTEYCLILKPLADALFILKNEKNLYFGYILPCLGSLFKKFERLEIENNNFVTLPILQACKEGLKKRFGSFLNFSSIQGKEAIIASFTLPKFKLKWINNLKHFFIYNTNKDLNDLIIKLVLHTALKLDMDITVNETINDTKEDEFFEFDENILSTVSFLKSYDKKERIELEILQYINDSNNQLNILNNYPYIKKLFFKFNTYIPSSTPVEKLFSFEEFVNVHRTHFLSDKNFENLILLKANSDRFENK